MEDFTFSYAGSDRQTHNAANHSHRGWELLYIVSGECKILFATGKKIDAKPGDVFLIPPHLEHERNNLGCCQTIYAVFECDSMTNGEPRKIETGGDRILRQWFSSLPELNRIYEPIQTASLIRTILLRLDWLEFRRKQDGAVHPSIKAACDCMLASLDRPIQVRDIARQAAISQSHLNLLFRTKLGVSPLRYLLMLRMNQARRLLLNPYHNISDVASQCGFSDLHYFSRCFSAYHGVPPRVYRRDPSRFADTENRKEPPE